MLNLQPYRRVSLAALAKKKLLPRFFGPFKVLERVGKVAYKLELPVSAKMHLVFHISYLKPFRGNHEGSPTLPPLQHGDLHPLPQAFLDTKLSKGQTRGAYALASLIFGKVFLGGSFRLHGSISFIYVCGQTHFSSGG